MSFQLRKVKLQSDVYLTCLQHALSTETFEIMGLLIGENEDNEVINILAVKILRRSDKKKDRVEISPEQLINAASQAEMLSTKLNKSIRVVGWYHSHPHITVYPSPVDVRTQASHQIMDLSFVGLIFSVFSENKKTKDQEIILTCFQTENEQSREIPLEIAYNKDISINCVESITELPKILAQEEEDTADGCKDHPDIFVSIYNNAVYVRALININDIVTGPLVQTLDERLCSNKFRSEYLRQQIDCLQNKFSKE